MSAFDLIPAPAPFERALAEAMSDTLPVPLREALTPASAPVGLLPWLAVQDGVRLWFTDWSDARKRAVIANSLSDNFSVGVRDGARRYLAYVDGVLLDAVAHPAPFVMGRSRIGRTPVGHAAFLARYLVRVLTSTPPRAYVIARGVIGRHRIKTPTREPLRRALVALRAAKAAETQYRVDFGHQRHIEIGDAVPLDGTFKLGDYVERPRF